MLKNKIRFLLSPEGNDGGNNTTNDEALDATLNAQADAPLSLVGEKVPTSNAKAVDKAKSADTPKAPPVDLTGIDAIGDLDEESDKGIVTAAKVEAAKAEAAPVKPTIPTAPADDTKTKGQRDYSLFQPDDEKILRQAGNNPVFNHFKEKLPKLYAAVKEAADLKIKLDEAQKGIVRMPESYNEHPDAYRLTPDYQGSVRFLQQANKEGQHWEAQLAKIEDGGDEVQDITELDANGNLVLSQPVKVTGSIKVKMQESLRKAEAYKQQFSQKIVNLRESHNKSYHDAVSTVTQECAKYFPWISNEKMFKETMVEIVTEKGKPPVNITLADAYTDALNMVHPAWRNHPLAQANANLIVSNLLASQKIRMQEAEIGIKKQIKKDEERAEVATSTKTSGVAKREKSNSLLGNEAVGSLSDLDD